MATVTAGTTILTGQTIDGDGGSASNVNLNDWLEAAQITDVTDTDIASANKDGTDSTYSLRRLVSDGSSTTSGKALSAADPRISQLNSSGYAKANTLVHNTTAISIASATPSAGQVLGYNGTNWLPVSVGASAYTTGTGTITATSGGAAVTGSGTIFTTELKVGDLIKTNGGAVRRVISIASATSLTVDSNWTGTETGVAWSFLPATKPRPYNAWTTKTADFTIAAADAGQAFAVDTSGGAINVTLPFCSSFLPGDTITIFKTTDDLGAINISRSGSDLIDGASSISFRTIGSVVVLSTDGVSSWHIVSKSRFSGDMIKSYRAYDSTKQSLTTQINPDATPTTSNGTKITGLTISFTPVSKYSNIRIRGLIPVWSQPSSTITHISAVVWSNANSTDTIRGGFTQTAFEGTGRQIQLAIDCQFSAGSTAAHTIDVYVGPSTGTVHYVGNNTNGNVLGGNVRAVLEVIEEAV